MTIRNQTYEGRINTEDWEAIKTKEGAYLFEFGSEISRVSRFNVRNGVPADCFQIDIGSEDYLDCKIPDEHKKSIKKTLVFALGLGMLETSKLLEDIRDEKEKAA